MALLAKCFYLAYLIVYNSHTIAPSLLLPTFLQGPKQLVETQVLCVDEQGRAGTILVLLYNLAASAANRYILWCIYVCVIFFCSFYMIYVTGIANARPSPSPDCLSDFLLAQLHADVVSAGAHAC